MLAVEPEKCYREWFCGSEERFVGAVCFTYLTLDAIAIYRIVEKALWHGDEHLCAVCLPINHS